MDQLLEAGCDVLACRAGSDLLAVGALKRLSADHAELKSMHTAQAARRRGAGRAVLNALLDLARSGGCTRVSLETGTLPHFQAAREMYRQASFPPARLLATIPPILKVSSCRARSDPCHALDFRSNNAQRSRSSTG